MRVLAVSQPDLIRPGTQLARYGGVISTHNIPRGRRAPKRRFNAHRAVRPKLADHALVLRRMRKHQHRGRVLGRGPHKRRPADINLLDQLFMRNAALTGGLFKRIKIDDHAIHRGDAKTLAISLIPRIAAPV